ncbi:OTU domain-containing protein 6B, partial [Stegodyphus mimosarum]
MAEALSYDEMLSLQRKERKELLAKTQKMKHGIPKGDKKRKKEVATEIAQLLADLDMKHEKQLKEYEGKNVGGELATSDGSDVMGQTSIHLSEEVRDVGTTNGSQLPDFYPSENKSQISEGSQKLSKAQKRRNKKSIMEKERIKAIIEQE